MADHRHDFDQDHHHHRDAEGFATGQEREPESVERERRGDFAEGQQLGHGPGHDAVEGDYAEGQEQSPHERDFVRDDFARGHDHDTTIDDDMEE
jgi:hypothetical protein